MGEINTALATRGEDFYFETLENVQNELEQEREKYDDLAKRYATGTAGITGAGIAGKLVPGFHSETAEHIDIVTQNDLATIGLIAALGISTVPAYKAKQHKNKRDRIDQLIEDLEEGNYDRADTEFAYEIADTL